MSLALATARNQLSVAPSGVRMLAYGLPALPLAFVALPIYVHLPKLYAGYGLSLASIGAILLLARCWDALIDPLIGLVGDRWGQRRRAMLLAMPLLAVGYAGLFLIPAAEVSLAGMLASLLIIYLGYSLASVNHHAWVTELSPDSARRTRLIACREAFALAGVLVAAVLPGVLASTLGEGLARLGGLFAVLLLCAALALFNLPNAKGQGSVASLRGLWQVWHGRAFRQLASIYALSGIAAAIPASLVLFFVADVLRADADAGIFLALYFLAGAAGLPAWVWLAQRLGKAQAWAASMLMAILVFAWAALLGPGDTTAFGWICVLSGLAFGADLTLPAALLADQLAESKAGAGSHFGWWNLVAKLNLALAAGLSLPLLGLLGYVPGNHAAGGLAALSAVYAGVPALLKLAALLWLWRSRDVLQTGSTQPLHGEQS